ncbi:MAG: glycosyl transferase [Planctomycetaceae bacterium]|nr:MAG: glycosyl transferase [Planctomycetaceae bacterium]
MTCGTQHIPTEVSRGEAGHPLRMVFVLGSLEPGGAERQVVELLRRLDRRLVQPALYVFYRRGHLEQQVPTDVPITAFFDPQRRQSVGWQWMGMLRAGTLAKVLHLACFLKHYQPDLVYERTLLGTLLTAPAAWLAKVPRCCGVVADPWRDIELSFRPWWRRPARWIVRWCYATAMYVLPNAEQLVPRLQAMFSVPAERLRVIRNLFDPARLPPVPPPQSRDHPTRLLAVGRLHPQKDYLTMLRAVELLVTEYRRQITLTILGSGRQEPMLKHWVHQKGLSSYVHFAGQVADPCTWMMNADLYLLSSVYEGLPNALLEAIACGLPVVATDCPTGPAEILEQGRWGELVPVGDSRAMAQAVIRVLDHYTFYRQRAWEARSIILEKFSPSLIIQQWEALLGELRQQLPPTNRGGR